jgi:hypothetical protein
MSYFLSLKAKGSNIRDLLFCHYSYYYGQTWEKSNIDLENTYFWDVKAE